MTQTRQARIAELEAEIAKLKEEEKASRPELAPGQVWWYDECQEFYVTCKLPDGKIVLIEPTLGMLFCADGGFSDYADKFEYLGLSRDVLRVVDPTQDPERNPEQHEIIGRHCLVSNNGQVWYGPYQVESNLGRPFRAAGVSWAHAKLYRKGVEP